MLPDDGPNGPKHVGAIQREILSVSCNILCFNKECIGWQKSFELFNSHFPVTTVGPDLFSGAYLYKFTVSMVPND
jgi:hypothetical protein